MAPNLDKAYEPPQPVVFTVQSASLDDMPALRSFVTRLAGNSRPLELHLGRARRQPDFTRIAWANGEIVGAALLSHTRLWLGPSELDTCHVDFFGVQESWRERGIFETLLGDMLRQMLTYGMPLALIAGRESELRPFGFAPFQFDYEISGWRTEQSTRSLRPAGEDDLEDLVALHEATYRHVPLSFARSPADWRALLTSQHAIQVLEDARGRVVAYVHGDTIIGEAAVADAGVARDVLAALGDQAVLHMPLVHPLAQAALLLFGKATVAAQGETVGASGMLAGVVDLPGMLEQLVSTFDERLARSRYAGWSGNLRIEIDTERVTLACDQGRTSVIDGSRPADVRLRRVSLPALAQCCLGYRAIADLRATGELDCDDSALGLLNSLFPVLIGG